MKEQVFIVRVQAARPNVDSHSSVCVTEYEPDREALGRYAQSHGVTIDVDVTPATLVAGNGLEEITLWLDRVADVDPKPVVERDRTEILIDELTRGMRNQERRVSQLADTVGKLIGAVDRLVSTSVSHVAADRPAPEIDWNAIDVRKPTETVAGRRVERGRPLEYGADSIKDALAENMTPNASGVVPGNMALRGASAASEMYVPGVNEDGTPGVRVALPKVGDTLKPKAIGEE